MTCLRRDALKTELSVMFLFVVCLRTAVIFVKFNRSRAKGAYSVFLGL